LALLEVVVFLLLLVRLSLDWWLIFTFCQNANPRFQGENFDQNKTFYFRFGKLAEKHGCTPAQLALAWILHQGDDVVPIPGEWLLWTLFTFNLVCVAQIFQHPLNFLERRK